MILDLAFNCYKLLVNLAHSNIERRDSFVGALSVLREDRSFAPLLSKMGMVDISIDDRVHRPVVFRIPSVIQEEMKTIQQTLKAGTIYQS